MFEVYEIRGLIRVDAASEDDAVSRINAWLDRNYENYDFDPDTVRVFIAPGAVVREVPDGER